MVELCGDTVEQCCGTVKQCWWNRVGGTVTVIVEQCGGTLEE